MKSLLKDYEDMTQKMLLPLMRSKQLFANTPKHLAVMQAQTLAVAEEEAHTITPTTMAVTVDRVL